MNKFVTISISVLLFLQSINIHLNDFAEIDQLIEHYQFHSLEYGDNFMVFMSKHYGEQKTAHSKKHQEEQKEHEKLPFQHQTQCVQHLVFVMESKTNPESISEIPLAKKGNFHYQNSYSTVWGDDPFQPPKHA